MSFVCPWRHYISIEYCLFNKHISVTNLISLRVNQNIMLLRIALCFLSLQNISILHVDAIFGGKNESITGLVLLVVKAQKLGWMDRAFSHMFTRAAMRGKKATKARQPRQLSCLDQNVAAAGIAEAAVVWQSCLSKIYHGDPA